LEKFEMKKTLVALAALAVVGAASAQVTLSGGVRAAIQNTGAAGAETSLSGNEPAANNITITAVEDLGGGMKVTALYHMRNDLMTGDASTSRPGTFVNGLWRNTAVWLDGGFGQVKAGRWGLSGLYSFDPFGAYGSVINPYAGGSSGGGRYTNMIQYQTPSFMGVTAQVGTSIDGSATQEDALWLTIDYAAGPLAVRITQEKGQALPIKVYTEFGFITAGKAATSGALTGLTAADDLQVTGVLAGASYDFGGAKLMAGYSTAKLVKSSVAVGEDFHVGVTVPMGAAVIKASYLKTTTGTPGAGFNNTGTDQTAIGVNYNLSKTTWAFADIGKNSSLANASWQVGLNKTF